MRTWKWILTAALVNVDERVAHQTADFNNRRTAVASDATQAGSTPQTKDQLQRRRRLRQRRPQARNRLSAGIDSAPAGGSPQRWTRSVTCFILARRA